jgi:2-polyprenyl-3-methyl-5-hydroxy-6-metoxy-1,4-benzoquinol methylase
VGFDVCGVESSPAAARYARERRGLNVTENSGEEWPEGQFDLVTLWEVVEHLRRPVETLQRLVRALRPGGVMCVTTPNLGCWRRRLEGGKWFNIKNPTHLAFYNRRTLSRLLRKCGLVEEVRPVFWGGRPGFGPAANLLQYVVRWLNLGSDLRLDARRPST